MKTLQEEYREQYPDIIPTSRVPVPKQRRFISRWHRHPEMSISELARAAGISRPTAYSLIESLEQRGDVRGEVQDGAPVLPSKIRGADYTGASRERLLQGLTVYEDFVQVVLQYFCARDMRYRQYRDEETGDINVPAFTKAVRRALEDLRISQKSKRRKRPRR